MYQHILPPFPNLGSVHVTMIINDKNKKFTISPPKAFIYGANRLSNATIILIKNRFTILAKILYP